MTKRIGMASDHGGRVLKRQIRSYLESVGWEVSDFGVADEASESVDYPDFAALVAQEVSAGRLTQAILICGTGIGMSIAANKFPNVRATLVWSEETAKLSREHNNSNILCLGERVVTPEVALACTKIRLGTSFAGDRHERRVYKIRQLEKALGTSGS